MNNFPHTFAVEHRANQILLSALTEDDTDALRIMQHIIVCQQHYLNKWRGDAALVAPEGDWSPDTCREQEQIAADAWQTHLAAITEDDLAWELEQRNPMATFHLSATDMLDKPTLDGFTVKDVLRMWVWHLWSHHRDLVRARGCIEGDNPHFHVPHFVRQANEEFGRFVGELACLTDDQLDLEPPDGERTVREVVEHVIGVLSGYVPEEVERACGEEHEG